MDKKGEFVSSSVKCSLTLPFIEPPHWAFLISLYNFYHYIFDLFVNELMSLEPKSFLREETLPHLLLSLPHPALQWHLVYAQ